jgi:hypothetical protein
MEQQETSGGRDTARKVHLPDTKDAYPIPDKWRLPFHGHLVTPTAVPSASERRLQLDLVEKKRRQQEILIGLGIAAAIAAVIAGALLLVLRR